MSEQHTHSLNWDLPLIFNNPDFKGEEEPVPQKISPSQTTPFRPTPPRQLIGQKYPKILDRIELLWCSLELHHYLEQTIFTDRSNREGFPQDVMQALNEIYTEHMQMLKQMKMIGEDVWDV